MDSSAPRILVTGGAGFLGGHLVQRLEREGIQTAVTLYHREMNFTRARMAKIDLKDRAGVARLLAELRPTIIIHTAAMTDSGLCEREPEAAQRENVGATQSLLDAAAQTPMQPPAFVFISTDLVFDGEHAPYHEDSPTAPVMHYGRTKLRAEEAVRAYPGTWTILRTALMYGPPMPHRASFLDWLVRPLREGKSVTLFRDEWRSPVLVDDVVEVLTRWITAPLPGLYHLGGGERISRFEMGEAVADRWGLPRELLRGVNQGDVALACPRPRDVSMCSEKLFGALAFRPVGFREGIQRVPTV